MQRVVRLLLGCSDLLGPTLSERGSNGKGLLGG